MKSESWKQKLGKWKQKICDCNRLNVFGLMINYKWQKFSRTVLIRFFLSKFITHVIRIIHNHNQVHVCCHKNRSFCCCAVTKKNLKLNIDLDWECNFSNVWIKFRLFYTKKLFAFHSSWVLHFKKWIRCVESVQWTVSTECANSGAIHWPNLYLSLLKKVFFYLNFEFSTLN